MSETALVVESRASTGKGAARKLRAAGRIPAILYGQGKQSVPLTLDPRALERVLKAGGANTLLDLTVEGRTDLGSPVALVKELQRHPIRGSILHADLYQVDLTKTVEVEVPIHLRRQGEGRRLRRHRRALAARGRARVSAALDSRVDRGRHHGHGDRRRDPRARPRAPVRCLADERPGSRRGARGTARSRRGLPRSRPPKAKRRPAEGAAAAPAAAAGAAPAAKKGD